jgi:transposase
MRMFVEVKNVYLCRTPVDFRKQINGLSALVQAQLHLDPFSEALFVFINRSRNRLKILYWERNGFCLWLKRLERNQFAWPRHLDDDLVCIDEDQLHWLLSGFDVWRHPPHPRLHFSQV